MDPSGPEAPPPLSDVRLCGYLRKQKSHRRRFFVLRSGSDRGPARLEYYESEKKFRAGGPSTRPKRSLPLAGALGISKRADARNRHLVVLCGRQGTFGVAAESAEQQQAWYAAMAELHSKGRESPGPSPPFKEVWQVSLRPRGLGHSRNLAGAYLLCLTERTISFVKLNSDVAAVVLQLLSVRRCGHSENYFFMEVGRSAATGPGELWMQVEDLVVAQNMHETMLDAMKALSEEFRLRSRSPALPSAPISVPPRRQTHPGNAPGSGQGSFPRRPRAEGMPSLSGSPAPGQRPPGARKADSSSDYSAVSSDEGGSSPGTSRPLSATEPLGGYGRQLDYIAMGGQPSPDGHRLAQWALGAEGNKRASLPPMSLDKDVPRRDFQVPGVSASYPEGLNLRDPGYMAMLPGVATPTEDRDYVPMTPSGASPPYVLMSPSGSCSPDGPWGPAEGKPLGGDYMNMSPLSRSASSTPPEYCPLLVAAPGSTPFRSLPRSFKPAAGLLPCPFPFPRGRSSGSSSTSSESLEGVLTFGDPLGTPSPAPRTPGEYISLRGPSGGHNYVSMELQATPVETLLDGYAEAAPGVRLGWPCPRGRWGPGTETLPETERNGGVWPPSGEDQVEPGLNYIDLDLAKEAAGGSAAEVAHPGPPPPFGAPEQAGPLHAYASIDFHRSGEFRVYRANSEGGES